MCLCLSNVHQTEWNQNSQSQKKAGSVAPFVEEIRKLRSSSFRNFLSYPITSSPLRLDILVRTFSWNVFQLCHTLNRTEQVLYPVKLRANV